MPRGTQDGSGYCSQAGNGALTASLPWVGGTRRAFLASFNGNRIVDRGFAWLAVDWWAGRLIGRAVRLLPHFTPDSALL